MRKKIQTLKFEICINYDKGKGPFGNQQQLINKIRTALKQQIKLMDEDGDFGKYQGHTAKTEVKLEETNYEGE